MLTDIYNELTGENKEPYTMGGGTYARKLPNAISFGPGLGWPKLPMAPDTAAHISPMSITA